MSAPYRSKMPLALNALAAAALDGVIHATETTHTRGPSPGFQAGAQTNPELTSHQDHPRGAGQNLLASLGAENPTMQSLSRMAQGAVDAARQQAHDRGL